MAEAQTEKDCPLNAGDENPSPVTTLGGASPISLALDHLRQGDTHIRTFRDADECWFSKTTKADIFEVKDGVSQIYRALDDNELRKHITDDAPGTRHSRRTRTIFLDGDENNPERLPITSSTLQLIGNTYNISPRFFFYLSRQQMAGSSMHHNADTEEPERLEFWYSAVIRTMADAGPFVSNYFSADNSRRVMNWLRCCVWSSFDAKTGDSTTFVWRYPRRMMEDFFSTFSGRRGAVLEQSPMLMHASWMERLTTHIRDINVWFSEPVYEVENETSELKSPADLFSKARNLTRVYRQIRQVLTDYEIVLVSIKSLRKQNEVMGKLLRLHANTTGSRQPSLELQHQLQMSFKQSRRELKLGKVYLTLYLERCTSGISDMSSVSNQHSAEIQIKTSREFTQLSRDSTEDNQSLRTIQIMTAIFLPPSLISSLFGMGFFSTSRGGDGGPDSKVEFTISKTWWWYLAITLPITILLLFFICREWITWHPHRKRLVWKRRPSAEGDLEDGLIKTK